MEPSDSAWKYHNLHPYFEDSMGTSGDSGPSSQDTSTPTSRPESAVIGKPSRKRVGFIPDVSSDPFGPPVDSSPSHGRQILGALTLEEIHEDGPGSNLSPVPRERPDISHVNLSAEIHKAFGQSHIPKPRPAIRRIGRTQSNFYSVTKMKTVVRRNGVWLFRHRNGQRGLQKRWGAILHLDPEGVRRKIYPILIPQITTLWAG